LLTANQLDGIHDFLGIGVFEQEREALDRFVRQPAAAWLFPCEMLVKNGDIVPRARELFTAHCAGRSAADDCYLRHGFVSLRVLNSVPGLGPRPVGPMDRGPSLMGRSPNQNQRGV